MFIPRLLANGQPCCARTLADGRLAFPSNACAACRDHANQRKSLRAAGDYTPPKPYAAWVDAMHAETNGPTTGRPTPLDANGVPTPYTSDIAKLRKEHR